MKRFVTFLKRTCQRVPIYGPLVVAHPDAWRGAAEELALATLFSLLPVWLYPLLMMFFDHPFFETLTSGLIRGELYLYSAALLGPLIYSVSKEYRGTGDVPDASEPEGGSPRVPSLPFPYRKLFSALAMLVCAIAAGVIAFIRASADGLLATELNETTTFWGSVVLYTFTLSCMFCVLVYRLDLERLTLASIPTHLSDTARELQQQWQSR